MVNISNYPSNKNKFCSINGIISSSAVISMICYNEKVLKNKRVDMTDVLNNTAANKNSSVFAWRLNIIAFVLAVLLGSLLGFFFGQYLLNWSKYAFQTNYQPGDTEVMQEVADRKSVV